MMAIWETVEELMMSGDERVKNAVATGFLEAILAAASGGLSIVSLARHFGPATMGYCRAWDAVTGFKTEGIS